MESNVKQQNKKVVSKKVRFKSFLNWFYGSLTGFSQEHMETFGYLAAMLPVIEELYDTKQEQVEAISTYKAFFNTEPQVGAVIVGVTVGLEEAKANGEQIDGETINSIRAGLMGPLAGIGDSLVVGTLIPILLGISLGLSTNGSPLGAIFYIVVWNLISFIGIKYLFDMGYRLGGKAVEVLVGEKANALRDSIILIGTIVIGGVAASWVKIKTSLVIPNPDPSIAKPILDLQTTLDSIYPQLLTFVVVIICWALMAKKKMSPLIVMLLLLVFAFLGCLVGFFNPNLSY